MKKVVLFVVSCVAGWLLLIAGNEIGWLLGSDLVYLEMVVNKLPLVLLVFGIPYALPGVVFALYNTYEWHSYGSPIWLSVVFVLVIAVLTWRVYGRTERASTSGIWSKR